MKLHSHSHPHPHSESTTTTTQLAKALSSTTATTATPTTQELDYPTSPLTPLSFSAQTTTTLEEAPNHKYEALGGKINCFLCFFPLFIFVKIHITHTHTHASHQMKRAHVCGYYYSFFPSFLSFPAETCEGETLRKERQLRPGTTDHELVSR